MWAMAGSTAGAFAWPTTFNCRPIFSGTGPRWECSGYLSNTIKSQQCPLRSDRSCPVFVTRYRLPSPLSSLLPHTQGKGLLLSICTTAFLQTRLSSSVSFAYTSGRSMETNPSKRTFLARYGTSWDRICHCSCRKPSCSGDIPRNSVLARKTLHTCNPNKELQLSFLQTRGATLFGNSNKRRNARKRLQPLQSRAK